MQFNEMDTELLCILLALRRNSFHRRRDYYATFSRQTLSQTYPECTAVVLVYAFSAYTPIPNEYEVEFSIQLKCHTAAVQMTNLDSTGSVKTVAARRKRGFTVPRSYQSGGILLLLQRTAYQYTGAESRRD